MKTSTIIRRQRGFFPVVVAAVTVLMSGITVVGVTSIAEHEQGSTVAQAKQSAPSTTAEQH